MAEDYYSPISSFKAGSGRRCPRCGRGRLYEGLPKIIDRCAVCGLDLTEHDAGDGPQVFVILILGFVVGFAFWVDVAFTPPLWVHALIWPPVILGGAPAMLRPLKAGLAAQRFRHGAGEYDATP